MRQQLRTQQHIRALEQQLGPGPWASATLVAAGMTPSSLRRAREGGRLVRVRRGVYARPLSDPTSWRDGVATTDVVVRARAALLTARDDAAVSHTTACVVHPLWLPWAAWPEREGIHLTVPGVHDRESSAVRVHGSPLSRDEVAVVDGIRVTSVSRTAIDVARGRPLPDALVVLDSAARRLAAVSGAPGEFRDLGARAAARSRALAELESGVAAQSGWPGIAAVRAALQHVDLGSESAFESRSRGDMHLARIPRPLVGRYVRGASGALYVADFLWEELRLIGEADGLGKYGCGDREVRERLAAERHRQRDLEDAGFRVFRWDTREAPAVWLARLRRAFGR